MKCSMVIAAALASAATAQSVGSAVVVNSCSYEVYLANVPAAGGGYSEIDEILAPSGGTYGQSYTQLSNGDGWSLKLSQSQSLASIMQYEYTFHDDGIIWFDLSDVNGNPWDGNWEITSNTTGCTPKQSAYRYSTDDAYGMQACSQDAVIRVELCSGDKGGPASSAISSVQPTTTVEPVATLGSSAIPTASSVPASSLVTAVSAGDFAEVSSASSQATTFLTAVASASSTSVPATTSVAASSVASSAAAPASTVTVSALSEEDFAPAPTPSAHDWHQASRHWAREYLHRHQHRRHAHAHI